MSAFTDVRDGHLSPKHLNRIVSLLTSQQKSIARGKGAIEGLDERTIIDLCKQCSSVFLSQPTLLELESPVVICGDIHGQFKDMLSMFDMVGYPPEKNFLFLGDYVDRGDQGIETICLLLAFKLLYPLNFFLLRGNHESEEITKIYGFYNECKQRYSVRLWKAMVSCFNTMPAAAVVGDKILCMHGGLSPDMQKISDVNSILRPTDIPDRGLLCDLLWSDPSSDIVGWAPSERGVSYIFGINIINDFCRKNDIDLICRAHQVVEDGYEFKANRRLVTIFSAPNYCGEFDNMAAAMNVDENLKCSFFFFGNVKKRSQPSTKRK